jgi:glycosyltransferase involved in cell wall biosynthesis
MNESLKKPKVTVLMAVYNGEKYLRESIESILGQTYGNFEFLIINDGSTDKSLEIIKSFKDTRIKVVNNSKNVGVASALNKATGLIKGEYIARMDCDDTCYPDRLEKEVAILNGNKDISIIAANVVLMDAEGKENGFWTEDIKTRTHEEIYRMLPNENCISNPTVMFRTSSFAKYKYHSFRKGSEDWDLWLQMASGGERFYKINEVLVKYRIHGSSVTAGFNRKSVYRKKNAIQIRYFLSKIISGHVNKFDLKVFRNGIINYIKYLLNVIHPSLLSIIMRMRGTSTQMVLGQFYKLYIFCRSTYYTSTSIYFFFPYYHIGGAEKIHAEIMQAVADKRPVCFITGISNESSFLEEFRKNSTLIDISLLTNYPFLSRVSKKMISKFIGRTQGVVTFGCNSKFYYQLIPYFSNNVKCIDLIHAFVHCEEDGAEYWSLPVTERLDKRIIISKKTIQDFKSLYNEYHKDDILLSRIEYIQNFTNVPAALNKAASQNLRILYVGRNGDEKRVYLIGKIAMEISKQNINAEFILVGDLGNAIALEERKYFSFKGIISNENEMQNIYASADILVLVSTREGFPMVIMEAMANGLVVISTNVGGIPEHISNGENGLLISSNLEEEVVKDITTYILLLNSDRDKLHRISVNAYNYAKKNFKKEIFQEAYRKILLPKEIKNDGN